MFKSVDKKLADISFVKEKEDQYGVVYTRDKGNYTHVVALLRKSCGASILQSYDRDHMDEENIGNICVGLTYYELELFMKKMKQLKMNQFEI